MPGIGTARKSAWPSSATRPFWKTTASRCTSDGYVRSFDRMFRMFRAVRFTRVTSSGANGPSST